MNKKVKIFSLLFGSMVAISSSILAISTLNSCSSSKEVNGISARILDSNVQGGKFSFKILENNKVDITKVDELIAPSGLDFNGGKFKYNDVEYQISDISASFTNNNSSIEGELTIPKTVERIGDWAFSNCSKITVINFNEGLQTIGSHAFSETTNVINTPIFPKTLKEIRNYAFEGSSIAGDITLSENITKLGEAAFKNCNAIKRIIFNNKLTYIDKCTCMDMNELEAVEIPTSITEIKESAFSNCPKLKDFDFNGGKIEKIGTKAFWHCTGIEHLVFNSEIKLIGDNAFEGCSSITSVDFNNGIKTIGDAAFKDCTGLLYVEDNPLVIVPSIESIGAHAFEGCRSISHISISNREKILPYKSNMFEATYVTKIIVSDQETKEKYNNDNDWKSNPDLLAKITVNE